jgi:2-(1,2-epoxy-1,2-dihydrophenyl)acetyl-CoA isomerase
MSAVTTHRDGAVLAVTLNRPEQLNAMNGHLLKGLSDAWQEAREPEVKAVVLTGAGRGFCAGADLRAQHEGASPGTSGLRHRFHPPVLAMAALDKPVLAAVNGPAAGAGLSLACAADIRIASDRARFVPAFARIGLVPDAGGTYFIPRILGHARALEWMASGRSLDAGDALDWGLVSEIVDHDELVTRAMERATALADAPGPAIGLTKRLFALSAHSTLPQQLEHEAWAQDLALASPERAAARAAVVDRMSSN